MFHWPVVPICEAQQLDVDPNDLLLMGVYRKCNTYKSGGAMTSFLKYGSGAMARRLKTSVTSSSFSSKAVR